LVGVWFLVRPSRRAVMGRPRGPLADPPLGLVWCRTVVCSARAGLSIRWSVGEPGWRGLFPFDQRPMGMNSHHDHAERGTVLVRLCGGWVAGLAGGG
jgi:hypothetical protein